MLILSVPEDFYKLLEDRRLASIASLSELSRVVIVAVYLPFMLIIAVLSSENSRTYRAGKMLNMVFSLQRSDI